MTSQPLKPDAVADLDAVLKFQKEEAHAAAMGAIAALLEELHLCLGGAKMRGLPVLSRFGTTEYRGVRLRTQDQAAKLSATGKAWGTTGLVLRPDGLLAVASLNENGEVVDRVAGESDLRAEDLQTITDGVRLALTLTMDYAQERGQAFEEIRSLADDLGALLRARKVKR